MEYSIVEKTSPLYDFWRSHQTDEDEEARLLIANPDSKAVSLFKNEPYKWEILFQSVAREIMHGDMDAINAMRILLSTVSPSTKEKTIQAFIAEKLFEDSVIKKIEAINDQKSSEKKNIFRFLRILFVIFTNPYGIEIRREKNHIYEITGTFLNNTVKMIVRLFPYLKNTRHSF